MKIKLHHDIRDLLLGWAKQPCPKCGEDLTFEEPCEGAPVEISCEECHIDFEVTA